MVKQGLVRLPFLAASVLACTVAIECDTAYGQTPVGLTPAVFAKVAKSLARVRAKDCPRSDGTIGERNGTAFAISGEEVVTALHVVSGCNGAIEISPTGPDGIALGVTHAATVQQVLNSADLALLKIPANTGLTTASIAPQSPSVNAIVSAVGYEYGAPGARDVTLRIANGSRVLRNLLGQRAQADISQYGAPSLDLAILSMQGQLVSGISGAPVVDQAGTIVGIADGGLEDGAAGVSWAIGASFIGALRASSDQVSSISTNPKVLFSADEAPPSLGANVVCGSNHFRHVRNIGLHTLVDYSSDPAATVDWFSSFSSSDIKWMESHPFSVWQHIESGSSVVVPGFLTLQDSGGRCVAMTPEGWHTLTLVAGTVPAGSDPRPLLLAEDKSEMPEPNWEEVTTVTIPDTRRPNGSTIVRTRFSRLPYDSNLKPQYDLFLWRYRTGGLSKNWWLSISVLKRHFTDNSAENSCAQQPTLFGCADLIESHQRFQAMKAAAFFMKLP